MMADFIPLSVPNFGGNERQYVNDAVVSEWVSTGGSMVGVFEEKIAEYAGAGAAVACASGTAGLHLAMLVAGVQPGDEVIAPALTFIAAVNPIRYAFAEPVFIGCDDTLCLDPAAVEDFCATRCELREGVLHNKTTGRPVRAIEVVHVFGNLAYMDEICATAKRYNLAVIEDATEAVGSRWLAGAFAGKMAGTAGDVGVYSYNGNKIITTGSGGTLVSRHPAWAKRAKHLSTQAKASVDDYVHDEVGYNYRMTNLQAALGLAQLEQLEGFVARKAELYELYRTHLDGKAGLRILPFREDTRPNRWFFSLYLTDDYPLDRDALIQKLKADNIQTRGIWGLINEQKPYLQNETHALGKAEDYRTRVVNLPCSTNLSDADAKRVCDA
ncbi:LegC family aminotransferase, partial [Ruminococcaceae bacterium OttesenSCG-928-D13]|nr:LegC family aminotransferase [Ruminococcaceae bacterium OttesenSCG-928-D13]